jgi:hypothetical protein
VEKQVSIIPRMLQTSISTCRSVPLLSVSSLGGTLQKTFIEKFFLRTLCLFSVMMIQLFVLSGYTLAQNLAWEQHFTSTSQAKVIDHAIGPSGDVFVATREGQSGYNYVKRFNSQGTQLWNLQYLYWLGAEDFRITTDASNNFYVSENQNLWKMDDQGNLIWYAVMQQQPGNVCTWGSFRDVAVDPVTSNLVATGTFTGTYDFHPGPGIDVLTSADCWPSNFVLALSSSGTFLWAKKMPIGQFNVNNPSVAFDQGGNIYFGSTLPDQIVDLNPGTGVFASSGKAGHYIVKFDPTGQFLWAKQTRLTSNVHSNDIAFNHLACDPAGNVTICGQFDGTFDIDPGPANQFVTNNDLAPFILQLDSTGTYRWSKSLPSGVFRNCVATANGNIHFVGSFRWDYNQIFQIPIGNQNLGFVTTNQTLNGENGFYYVVNANGTGIGLDLIIGNEWQRPVSVQVGNYSVCGNFKGDLQFDPPSGVQVNVSSSLNNFFVAQYAPCSTITGPVQNIDYCRSATSPSGLFQWSNSNLWADVFQSVSGCDSLVPIQASFIHPNVNLIYTSTLGWLSNESDTAATFQWLDCNAGFQPISGQTLHYFVDTINYSAALEVNINGCRDTSYCRSVGPVSRSEPQLGINLYPNPSKGSFQIEGAKIEEISIFNTLGQRLEFTWVHSGNGAKVDLDAMPGVYFVTIHSALGKVTKRILMQ